MARTLNESEFDTIKAKILEAAPAGLKEDEFNRYIGPAMAQAIGTAENSPEPLTGSALERFASGAWRVLNPMGLVNAAMHPLDTASALVGAQQEQGQKAMDAARAGRYSEAVGHGAAALLPVVGPAAANAGERIGSGDVAGGLGEVAGLMAPVAASAARVPIGQATSAVGRTAEAVGKSAPMRRLGTIGAVGEVMRGDLVKAGLSAAAPVVLEKGGQALQTIGGKLSGAPAAATGPLSDLQLAQQELAAGRLTPQQYANIARSQAQRPPVAPQGPPAPAPIPPPVARPAAPEPVAGPSEPPPTPTDAPKPAGTAPSTVKPIEMPKVVSPTAAKSAIGIAARRAGVEIPPDSEPALIKAVMGGMSPEEAVSALKPMPVEDAAALLQKRFGLPSDAERTFPPNKSGLPTKAPTARKGNGKIADLADMMDRK